MLHTIAVYYKFEPNGCVRDDTVVNDVTGWSFEKDYFYIYTNKSHIIIDKYLIARVSIEEQGVE